MKDMEDFDVPKDSTWTDNTVRPPDYQASTGYKAWYRFKTDPYKILHNLNGPAVIFPDGEERYYIDGFEAKATKKHQ